MRTAHQQLVVALVLLVAAWLSGELFTAAAGIASIGSFRLWRRIRDWRDPVQRELRRLVREGQKVPDVILTSAGAAFVSPTPETRNPIGSEADMWMRLDDEVQHATIFVDGAAKSVKDIFGSEAPSGMDGDSWTLEDLEHAAAETGGEWSVRVEAPLWAASWRREGTGRWVCTAHGLGYA